MVIRVGNDLVHRNVVSIHCDVAIGHGACNLVDVYQKQQWVMANFQAAGNLPVIRDRLKIFITLDTIEGTVAFSILGGISSAPVAFFTSREEMSLSTSS